MDQRSYKHKILLIEHSSDLGTRIVDCLESQGYTVVWEIVSYDGLVTLEHANNQPFSLIISSHRMPKMTGDEILKRAREISPDTQRLLMVDSNDIAIITKAINQAQIHGSLALPFEDADLVRQVRRSCLQYERIQNRLHLESVTKRQNRQMYKMALSFQTRDKAFADQIEEKKKEILSLKEKQSVEKFDHHQKDVSLEAWIERRGIQKTSEGFAQGMSLLKDTLKDIVNIAVSSHDLRIDVQEAGEIPGVVSGSEQPSSDHDKVIKGKEGNLSGLNSGIDEVINRLLQVAYSRTWDEIASSNLGKKIPATEPGSLTLENCLEINISQDRIKATAKLKRDPGPGVLTLESLLELLDSYQIRFGIMDDTTLQAWIKRVDISQDAFVVAKGIYPEAPRDASVNYRFEVDFKQAGKVLEDGSIDFRDRGAIPFVKQGTLLAEKTPVHTGNPGTDVSGAPIPLLEPQDRIFLSGPGTRFSEDQLKIYADIDGQPHLDAKGTVCVFSELNIDGDVDYNTGNIDFQGNIIVKGTVREGFKIKGATLTAGQIEGAEIDLTGDLNVSSGIIDARLIKVQGLVQAKYVNNSIIKAFGDLMVQKEIIDSTISLSGSCINETGVIIASNIIAKLGVQAGAIGTEKSGPSKLRIGVDDHIREQVQVIESQFKENNDNIALLRKAIEDLKAEDQALNGEITGHAHVQDRSQLEIRSIEKSLPALKASGDIDILKKLAATVKELSRKAAEAEKNINAAFVRQDAIQQEITEKKNQVKLIEDQNHVLELEKRGMDEYSDREKPKPFVKATKKIMPGTIIEGPNAMMKVREEITRSRIEEIRHVEGGYYSMEIRGL